MSWSALKTEAIILSSVPFREADRRYSAMTRDFGKVEFVGRGARKGKAKLAAHLEPFAVVDLEIIRGRRSMTIISVERKQVFKSLMTDIDRRIIAQTSLQLIDKHVREFDSDEILYTDLIDWIIFLNEYDQITRSDKVLLFGSFLFRLMRQLGYEAVLENCISCKQKILPLAFRWHGGKGGLVCSDCVVKNQDEWFAARKISEESVKILRFAGKTNYQDIAKTRFELEYVEDFARIVHDLMQCHLPVDSPTPFWQGLSYS
jgi:DNA repair protein RecO (recombination protein O)